MRFGSPSVTAAHSSPQLARAADLPTLPVQLFWQSVARSSRREVVESMCHRELVGSLGSGNGGDLECRNTGCACSRSAAVTTDSAFGRPPTMPSPSSVGPSRKILRCSVDVRSRRYGRAMPSLGSRRGRSAFWSQTGRYASFFSITDGSFLRAHSQPRALGVSTRDSSSH